MGHASRHADGIVLVSKLLAESSQRVGIHTDRQAAETEEVATQGDAAERKGLSAR